MKDLILAVITFFVGFIILGIINQIFKIGGQFIFIELGLLIFIVIIMLLKYVKNQSPIRNDRAKWVRRISKKIYLKILKQYINILKIILLKNWNCIEKVY